MIAMSMISTYDEYRRGRMARPPSCPAHAHPLRRAMMHALAMFGLGIEGVVLDNEELSEIG